VISALPVDTEPDDNTSLTVTLLDVTTEAAVLQVWRTRPLLGLGLLPTIPAGPGITVHCTAVPLPQTPPVNEPAPTEPPTAP
jgi:hypothetical protein